MPLLARVPPAQALRERFNSTAPSLGNALPCMHASVSAARCDLRRQLKFGLQVVVEMYVFVATSCAQA
jgi:hypothetical protein